ncbi:MAG TPA: aspartate-semialdehyde dehydrogenase [Gaiellales bacterium]|nr:aspartate-semialdehyde dehydrogenase [Gaiellales bacterium]
MSEPRVAVVGATGAVGPEVLSILAERSFPASEVVPFASARSAGTRVAFGDEQLEVRELTEDALGGFDLALFSAGGGTSKRYAPEAVKRGCVVIDKSSAFRMDPSVPLVVPEVNGDAAAAHQGIISNPNCSTIQLVMALKPLHDAARIRHMTIATYQAVSGTGKRAMDELRSQSLAVLQGADVQPDVYPHPIAFNALPHCDAFEGDETTEETKLVNETHKILEDDSIGISATCVRVPVWRSHSEAVWIETAQPLGASRARELLESAPGVRLVDDPANARYPMPSDAAGADDVLVGRIREDRSRPNGLALWVVADNLRKGAALNGVQIAELLAARNLIRVPEQERVA